MRCARWPSLHGMPVVSVHAPTLLVTQRVWGPDPWAKVDRSLELAARRRAPTRWCCTRRSAGSGTTPRTSSTGWPLREHDSGIALAVENMFPWRARNREMLAYLPHWDPVSQPYDHVTLDLSHTATAGSDAMDMAATLGPRLRHVHLADGSGSSRDEHLVPGRGTQPCAELLETLAQQSFEGSVVVEVGTRRRDAGASGRPTSPRRSRSPGCTWPRPRPDRARGTAADGGGRHGAPGHAMSASRPAGV